MVLLIGMIHSVWMIRISWVDSISLAVTNLQLCFIRASWYILRCVIHS